MIVAIIHEYLYRFSYITSNIAPSHSSCPTSFSICNLTPEFRYRTSNLLLTSILPGPKEQTADEIQRFIRPIISDLRRLWADGITVYTPNYPHGLTSCLPLMCFCSFGAILGRLLRVALVALVCDKPAAHKIAGYGPTSCTMFCTVCKIKQANLKTPEAFKHDGTSHMFLSMFRHNNNEFLVKPLLPGRTESSGR